MYVITTVKNGYTPPTCSDSSVEIRAKRESSIVGSYRRRSARGTNESITRWWTAGFWAIENLLRTLRRRQRLGVMCGSRSSRTYFSSSHAPCWENGEKKSPALARRGSECERAKR